MQVQPGLIDVASVEDHFPGLRRITFAGSRLDSFPTNCSGGHIKLFFPSAPDVVPELPHRDATGSKVWPLRRPITRTYSVRSFDALSRYLTVDFVLHQVPGPASDWARAAVPGQRIGIAGPAVPPVLAQRPAWNLFVGDLSALPMIGALVECLPADAFAEVLLELPTPRPVTFQAKCQVVLTQHLGERGAALLSMVQHVVWPHKSTPHRACVAAESSVTVAIRRYLEQSTDLEKGCMYTVPYWKYSATEEEYHEERHAQMDAMEDQ